MVYSTYHPPPLYFWAKGSKVVYKITVQTKKGGKKEREKRYRIYTVILMKKKHGCTCNTVKIDVRSKKLFKNVQNAQQFQHLYTHKWKLELKRVKISPISHNSIALYDKNINKNICKVCLTVIKEWSITFLFFSFFFFLNENKCQYGRLSYTFVMDTQLSSRYTPCLMWQ